MSVAVQSWTKNEQRLLAAQQRQGRRGSLSRRSGDVGQPQHVFMEGRPRDLYRRELAAGEQQPKSTRHTGVQLSKPAAQAQKKPDIRKPAHLDCTVRPLDVDALQASSLHEAGLSPASDRVHVNKCEESPSRAWNVISLATPKLCVQESARKEIAADEFHEHSRIPSYLAQRKAELRRRAKEQDHERALKAQERADPPFMDRVDPKIASAVRETLERRSEELEAKMAFLRTAASTAAQRSSASTLCQTAGSLGYSTNQLEGGTLGTFGTSRSTSGAEGGLATGSGTTAHTLRQLRECERAYKETQAALITYRYPIVYKKKFKKLF